MEEKENIWLQFRKIQYSEQSSTKLKQAASSELTPKKQQSYAQV